MLNIPVGSNVRSFDFAVPGKAWGRDLTGERAAYVEGTLVGYEEFEDGTTRAKILVTKDVFGGRVKGSGRIGNYVFPPANGTPYGFSGEACDGIELL